MYSMPIVGTNANLYFPSERSQDPMVIGCVRKNGSSCSKFSNVNNRYFSTESGNNLDMLPGAINFSRPGLSATFNDGGGVNLSSSSSLSLNAGYVGLFAGNILIEAQSKLEAKKGGSTLSLEDEFSNSAGIVKENGRDRASNGNFTDDEPTIGATEARAAMETTMKSAVQAVVGALALASAVQGTIGETCECLPSKSSDSSMYTPEGIPITRKELEECSDVPQFNPNYRYANDILVNGTLRNNDTEYKILENYNSILNGNSEATGAINIYSERTVCPSCDNVAKAFSRDYPNLEIGLIDSSGKVYILKNGEIIR